MVEDPPSQDATSARRSTKPSKRSKTPTWIRCRTCSRASTSTARSASARSTTTRWSNFIQNFEKIPLRDENFEFPDLLGAAYEYLIKFFADSAGKKGGEFYTPPRSCACWSRSSSRSRRHERLRPDLRLGRHADPVARVRRECGGDPRNLALASGRRASARIWSICKMNMLLHGIPDADIRQGDTIRRAAAHGRERRAEALRPRDRQSAVLPELHQEGHRVSRPLRRLACRRRARRPT